MAANYGFTVTMNADTAKYLSSNGFNLCVSKQVNSSDSGVVWLSIPVQAQNIGLTWQELYSIYFTTTSNQSGATIVQSSTSTASMGVKYTYADAVFTNDGPEPTTPSSIVILNQNSFNMNGSNFGLAQSALVNGNAQVATPINITTVPYKGKGIYTPNVTVTFAFMNTIKSPGVISVLSGATQTITLISGKIQSWNYLDGAWTPNPSAEVKGETK